MTRTRAVVVAFAVIAAGNLIAVVTGDKILEWLTKPLVTLLLIAHLAATGALRRPTGRLVTVALAAACVADVALLIPGDLAFLVGMAFFLIMQLLYLRTFWYWDAARSMSRVTTAALLAVVIGYVVVMWPKLGDLAAPMLVYGLALTAMAALGTGLGLRVGVGGVLFFVSDLTIGLGVGGYDYPLRNVVVMGTYILAQFLIVTGWNTVTARRLSAG